MPSRFRVRGATLEGLKWRLQDQYGSRARIISAERIQVGGLFGLGASTSYEVEVEVDGGPVAPHTGAGIPGVYGGGSGAGVSGAGPAVPPLPSRRGISALLAEADRLELAGSAGSSPTVPSGLGAPSGSAGAAASGSPGTALPGTALSRTALARTASPGSAAAIEALRLPRVDPLSTQSPVFEQVLAAMEDKLEDETTGVPRLAAGPGDLVVLAGLRDAPLNVARSMARSLGRAPGVELRTAGEHRAGGVEHVILDGGGLRQAQALAAVAGKPVVVAFSVGNPTPSNPFLLSGITPDQVWAVVDAAHKPEDTQSWVRQVAWFTDIDALAVYGAADTATPETVNELGYPVGWLDGHRATAPTL